MEGIITLIEKLGVGTEVLLFIVLSAFLTIWLYKQVSAYLVKEKEKELAYIENSLTNHRTLIKACFNYNRHSFNHDEMYECLLDSIQYIDKELFLSMESMLLQKEPIEDNCVQELRKKILYLKDRLDDFYPSEDKDKVLGQIASKIRIIETIFEPVKFTGGVLFGLAILVFVYSYILIGKFNAFILGINIVLVAFFILSVIATIIDKKFNWTLKSAAILVGFFLSNAVLMYFYNIFTLITAFFTSLILMPFLPKYFRK